MEEQLSQSLQEIGYACNDVTCLLYWGSSRQQLLKHIVQRLCGQSTCRYLFWKAEKEAGSGGIEVCYEVLKALLFSVTLQNVEGFGGEQDRIKFLHQLIQQAEQSIEGREDIDDMIWDQTREVDVAVEFSHSKKYVQVSKNKQDFQITKEVQPLNFNNPFPHVIDTYDEKEFININETQELLGLPEYMQNMEKNTKCCHFLDGQMKISGQVGASGQQIGHLQNQKLRNLQDVSNLLCQLNSGCSELGNRQ